MVLDIVLNVSTRLSRDVTSVWAEDGNDERSCHDATLRNHKFSIKQLGRFLFFGENLINWF